jgi:hypothetical protein
MRTKITGFLKISQLAFLSSIERRLVGRCLFRLHKHSLVRVVLNVAVSVYECLSANESRLKINH